MNDIKSLYNKDIDRLLSCIEEMNSDCRPEALPSHIIKIIGHLISSDSQSYNLLNSQRQMVTCVWEPLDPIMPPDKQQEILMTHLHEHPFFPILAKSGTMQATRLSDVCSKKHLRSTGLYNKLYQPLGIEYQMCASIPINASSHLVLAINRKHRDFTAQEKKLLSSFVPHIKQRLIQSERQLEFYRLLHAFLYLCDSKKIGLMFLAQDGEIQWRCQRCKYFMDHYFGGDFDENTLPDELKSWFVKQQKCISWKEKNDFIVTSGKDTLHVKYINFSHGAADILLYFTESKPHPTNIVSKRLGLSKRETEVLVLVENGKSNEEISTLLFISHATVKKHLENIYRKLGVKNRIAASRIWHMEKTKQGL